MANAISRFLALDDAGDRDGAFEVLKERFDEFNRGNRAALLDILDDDVEWIVPAIFPLQDLSPGRAGVVEFLDEQLEPFEEFVIVPDEYIRNGNRAAILVRQRARGRASGADVEIRVAQLWTIEGDTVVRFEGIANHDDARRRIAASE